jgi:beta-galactosidase
VGRVVWLRPKQWIVNFMDLSPVSLGRVSFNSDYVDVRGRGGHVAGPRFAYAKFVMRKASSSRVIYFLLRHFTKGVVFLNGYSLGRYWSVGPMLTLYVPDEFLFEGVNELMVFDLFSGTSNNSDLELSANFSSVVYIVDRNVHSFI